MRYNRAIVNEQSWEKLLLRCAGLKLILLFLMGCGENLPAPLNFNQINKIKNFPGLDAIEFKANRYDAGMRLALVNAHTSSNIISLSDNNTRAMSPALNFSWEEGTKLRPSLRRMKLFYEGKEVLGAELKFSRNNASVVLGAEPTFSLNEVKVLRPTLSMNKAKLRAAESLKYHPWRFKNAELVYLPVEDGLVAVYKFFVSASPDDEGNGPASPLEIYLSSDTGEVFAKENQETSAVNGEASVFVENNAVNTSLSTVNLENLDGTGYLEGKHLRIVSCKDFLINNLNCKLRLNSSTHQFEPEFSSLSYEEATAYYAISKSMKWHKTLMNDELSTFENFGLKNPMDVFVRVKRIVPGGSYTLMSAAYVPQGLSGDGKPIIIVGSGWDGTNAPPTNESVVYKNLGKDADIYFHEFGHQIVYRSLKSFDGQIGGLHEGFADYFAYAMTGNNKLGESVGLSGPVRKAEFNPAKPSIIDWHSSKDIHASGEFWSACLWDIRKKMGIWKDNISVFDKIVWDSIDYLPQETNYYQAVAALVQSAKDFSTQNSLDFTTIRAQILTTFQARGFFASGADLPNGIPPPATELSLSSASQTALARKTPEAVNFSSAKPRPIQRFEADHSKSRLGKSSCGVIASQGGPSSILAHLALLFPLFILFFRKSHSRQKQKI